ncbi:MAG: hypothetical protein JSV80_04480, partial [Acidobacteriota bacterium]
VPICATIPANRLLLFAGFGGMGLLAQFLGSLTKGARATSSSGVDEQVDDQSVWPAGAGRWLAGAVAVPLMLIHFVLAPLMLPISAVLILLAGEPVKSAILSIPPDPQLAEQDLVVVNAPDYVFTVCEIWALRRLEAFPTPRRLRGLVTAPVALDITRVDQHSLSLRFEQGLFQGSTGELFRGPSLPMSAGDRLEVAGMSVELTEVTAKGEPTAATFRFPVPLEDRSLRWVRFDDGLFVPFDPPPIGESVQLEAARGPLEMTDLSEIVDGYRRASRRLEAFRATRDR